MGFGIYVHIPYCTVKCPYCDFNVHVVPRWPEQGYVEALRAELRHAASQPAWRERRVETVFLGGGTPSLFAAASIERILDQIRAAWPLAARTEVTLEANPEKLEQSYLERLRAAGVNRLSLGVQSFQPRSLRMLGRLHEPDDAVAALQRARAAGFDNVSIDLICASPGQEQSEWEQDLRTAVDLGPEHVSTYALTYEEGTAFHKQRARGRLRTVDEEDEAAMLERGSTILERAGYERYEISNHARRGRRSRHNLNTWNGADYLGAGAGAHSFLGAGWGRRWGNEREPRRYAAAIAARREAIDFLEELTREQAMTEWVLLGLRRMQGIDTGAFERRFRTGFSARFPRAGSLCDRGLLAPTASGYRLTRAGTLVADAILAAFA